MQSSKTRLFAGTGALLALVAVVALAASLFRGVWSRTDTVTVIIDRAGLVMNPDAKVKFHGAPIGHVESITSLSDGTARLDLAIEPRRMNLVPANVTVDIASSTVFGAKYVDLVVPANASAESLSPGQTIRGRHVTVEINTVFEQLVGVLDKVDPAKLNETLGALAAAMSGRGEKFGQALANLDEWLVEFGPSLPNLEYDLSVAPEVLNAYADAAPDLMSTIANSTRLADTIVGTQTDLDRMLLSTIGFAGIGTEVLSANRQGLTETLDLLVPTTDLLNEYHSALNCSLQGFALLANQPPPPVPGSMLLTSFVLGKERYRYPQNLPKVAATGGPQCAGLPDVGPGNRAPMVVADIGIDPAQYGNQGILLNSDGLKQWLFGPLDGPPRNSTQIGQPG